MRKTTFILAMFMCMKAFSLPSGVLEQKSVESSQPFVMQKILEQSKRNKNWKYSLKTGGCEQITFMEISKATSLDNETGRLTNPFDQVIIVASGRAEVTLNGKKSSVKSGDVIFIPKGTVYNIANKVGKLKLACICSNVPSPKDLVYKNKIDEKK